MDLYMFVTVGILFLIMMMSSVGFVQAQNDFSEPIKCFYCYGPADNSTCADPVDPREDKDKALQVIECERGICLKWTHYWNNVLYMHRTCSHKLNHFRIMMIDGVCRSERMGNGYLCMCGKHLCNSTTRTTAFTSFTYIVTLIAAFISWCHPHHSVFSYL